MPDFDPASLDDVQTGSGGDDYQPPSEFVRPPDAATFVFMRQQDTDNDFKKGRSVYNDAGFAWFNFKTVIQGGPFDGRIVFAGCNTLVSAYRHGSSADDFLRASKSTLRPTTVKTYEDAVEKTFGPFMASVNWEWRCRTCEETFLKGAKNPKAPKKYEGPKPIVAKRQDKTVDHVQVCPQCKADVGAQATIATFIVPRADQKSAVVTAPAPQNLPPAAG